MIVNFFKKYYPILIIIGCSYLVVKPLLIPGFFPMHDDTQVARVFEMAKALKDGLFPVRWVQDLGYGFGYPIFNFYAPLAYYIGAGFTFVQFDALLGTRLMMLVGIVFAGISMYFLSSVIWGKPGGLVAGVIYLFFPYHAVDIYVRGAVAEIYAYAFLPLVFLAFHKLFITSRDKKTSNKWIFLGAIFLAAVFTSHNLTAFMLLIFLFLQTVYYLLLSIRKNNFYFLRSFVLTCLLGFSLSAWYVIPAIGEMRFTNVFSQVGGGADFRDHFVCLNQLWDSQWGFGGSTKGCTVDGFSFRIGKIEIFLTIISLILFSVWKKKDKDIRQIYFFAFIGLIFSIFMMLAWSQFLWEIIPLIEYIQYPWRFLVFTGLFISLLSGAIPLLIWQIISKNKKTQYITAVVIIVIIIFVNTKLFSPQTIHSKTVKDYTSELAISWIASKASDEYLPKHFLKPKDSGQISRYPVTFLTGQGNIETKINKTNFFESTVTAFKNSELLVAKAPFPAWHISANDKSIKFTTTNKGYVAQIKPGAYTIRGVFVQTPLQSWANGISLGGAFITLLGIIIMRKKLRKNNNEKTKS